MERSNTRVRTCLRAPRSPDRQCLIEALGALDNDNLELSMENAFLVEQTIEMLKTHAKKQDELNKKILNMKKKLKAYKNERKEIQDKEEGVLLLLKRCDALLTEIIEMQDSQMEELKKTEAASQDQPEGVRSDGNAQTYDALQQFQNDLITKINQLQERIKEKNEIISNLTVETKAKTKKLFRVYSKLTLKQAELDQSIKKCNTLQQEFKQELAKREESWKIRKNEMERLWLEREDTLKESVRKAEEELQQVIIQNIKLQELVFEKKKQGFWAKRRQENRNKKEEEEAAANAAQVGHEEEEEKEEKKKKEKVKKWCFWKKKNQEEKGQQVEEAAAGLDHTGQEERQAEETPEKQGCFGRGRKKKEERAQRSEKEEEGAACPKTGE